MNWAPRALASSRYWKENGIARYNLKNCPSPLWLQRPELRIDSSLLNKRVNVLFSGLVRVSSPFQSRKWYFIHFMSGELLFGFWFPVSTWTRVQSAGSGWILSHDNSDLVYVLLNLVQGRYLREILRFSTGRTFQWGYWSVSRFLGSCLFLGLASARSLEAFLSQNC